MCVSPSAKQQHQQPQQHTKRPFRIVYIYTSLIEVKFLEIECCFVFSSLLPLLLLFLLLMLLLTSHRTKTTKTYSITSRKTNSYVSAMKKRYVARNILIRSSTFHVVSSAFWLARSLVRAPTHPRFIFGVRVRGRVLIFFLCFVKYLRIPDVMCVCVLLSNYP